MRQDELKAAGFVVSTAAHARLTRFVQILLEESERLKLTAARTEAEVWRVHVCDSLALSRLVREHEAASVLDLGSGGGLPGVPLACVCERVDVTLVDATRKKVDALRRIIDGLGLGNAHTIWGRAETLAHEPAYREQFDAVAARAVATLPVLIEYGAGFVRPGGHCWFFKSAAAAGGERARAESAARTCRLEYSGTVRYRLPGESDDRVLVGYCKGGVLDDRLPRRVGRATKRPL